ncbi:GNAT family N-acetyltransferase [Acidilutibacter cellobiosedens]|jgi:putative acetyltransferase|uniref:GNAT family N-acetyltransferase n=1 Tax=Acidilutibacter cellobiosedens TaxID=2507161 RepID=A0A410QFZ9_9FIRM|nr:GNAT family N-acetyltransferase [Acidilutibacter cellobiosedens]QAT62937.1 GNAT family N-acetyltransferase [Acidilutibacter cellobiosedens]
MIIRKYKPSDCAFMAKLFYDTVHTINSKDYTNEQLNAWATGNVDLEVWNSSFIAHNTLVAVINGGIVGFADMDYTGYLDKLYVHKDFQRRGIATALVKELERCARKVGLFNFKTHASITAKPFFEKQGYTVEAENKVIRNGIALVNYKMVKNY